MTEMLDDTMESLDDNEDELEEDAQEEVDKVLLEITGGKLGQAAGPVGKLPVSRSDSTVQDALCEADLLLVCCRRRVQHQKSSRRTRRWNAPSRDCSQTSHHLSSHRIRTCH